MVEKISASPIRKLYENQSTALLKKDTSAKLSFGDLLKNAINRLNESQLDADNAIKTFLKGEIADIHKVMLVLAKANLNLRLAMQFRNKIISAYEEIMRIQI